MKHIVHGELNFVKTDKLPKLVKKIKPKDGRWIVADSEVTGNHHCVKQMKGVELFEKDGVLYMRNSKPAEIFCVDVKRHDTVIAEPGVWEITPSQEFDYLTMEKRNVAD